MTGNETASRQAVRDDRKVRVQRRTGELMWRMSGRAGMTDAKTAVVAL